MLDFLRKKKGAAEAVISVKEDPVGKYDSIPKSTSDTELQRSERVQRRGKIRHVRNASSPAILSPNIGHMFRQDSWISTSSVMTDEASQHNDPILRVRHVAVTLAQTPAVVHRDGSHEDGSVGAVTPEIFITPTSEKMPQIPCAPPPSPYEGVHLLQSGVGDNLTVQGKINGYGKSISSSRTHLPPFDYLNVDIPEGNLSVPAEFYQMFWGKL